MSDRRDVSLAALLRPLRDGLPAADWQDVIRRRAGDVAPAVVGAMPIPAARAGRRRLARPLGIAVAAVLLAAAVALAGLQGIRSQPGSHRGVPAQRPARAVQFSQAFSHLAARPSDTDPDVLKLAADISAHVDARLGTRPAVHELPSDARVPVYVAVGTDDQHLALFGGPGGSPGVSGTTAAAAANPEFPGLLLVRAADDGIVAVGLVADDVVAVRVLTAEGSWVDMRVRDNVATARLDARPARVLTTLRNGSTVRWDEDVARTAGSVLPPSRTAPYAGDIERQFAAAHPEVLARVGPAVIAADGSVGLPVSVTRRIADIRASLLACLAAHRIPVGPLGEAGFPRDPHGRKAAACPREMAAVDAYAPSLDMSAAGVLRLLTAFAINPCLAKAPDAAARSACIAQFSGRLPPFPDWAHPASTRKNGPPTATG